MVFRRKHKRRDYEELTSREVARRRSFERRGVSRDRQEEQEGRKSRTRKIRDLNPRPKDDRPLAGENKKRRKQPPKPWGRKERLIILVILLFTVGTSAVLAISSRAWKLPGLPRLKLPSFSLPFSGEETIVIEGDRDRVRERERAEKVIAGFKEETKNLSGVYGLYVVNLSTGFAYGVNETEVFESASLNKLPVMAGMYMEEEGGSLSLESKYKLKNSDKTSGAGSLYSKPEGYEITYRNLIRLMGKQSDNTAFNITKNILGEEKIYEVITKIGMKRTSLAENETTPQDIGIFFEELWHGNIINGENKNELLDYLTDTIYENWITKGVPEDVRVSHKYGNETNVVNDAGVVFTEKPFILVIMSKGVVEREANDIFPDLARIVYEAEAKK